MNKLTDSLDLDRPYLRQDPIPSNKYEIDEIGKHFQRWFPDHPIHPVATAALWGFFETPDDPGLLDPEKTQLERDYWKLASLIPAGQTKNSDIICFSRSNLQKIKETIAPAWGVTTIYQAARLAGRARLAPAPFLAPTFVGTLLANFHDAETQKAIIYHACTGLRQVPDEVVANFGLSTSRGFPGLLSALEAYRANVPDRLQASLRLPEKVHPLIKLVAAGYTDQQIAWRQEKEAETVTTQIEELTSSQGLETPAQLAIRAIVGGIKRP